MVYEARVAHACSAFLLVHLQFAKKLPFLHGFPASGAQTSEVVHCEEGVSAELML